jgi:hypothetical protein
MDVILRDKELSVVMPKALMGVYGIPVRHALEKLI